jgi:hypothetical protein
MAGFIDAAVQDIDNRLRELREEEQKLTAARAALVGVVKRGPGRPPRSESVAAPVRRGRRPGRPRGRRGSNTRSTQALELVRSKPGITIPQIADSLKIEPNYLYRVMPKLTADGLVTRVDQGWHPVAEAGAAK